MNESLSILGLITHASIPVKLVMFALISSSIYSWTLIVKYRSVHRHADRALKNFEEQFWSGTDLGVLYQQSQHGSPRNRQNIITAHALCHGSYVRGKTCRFIWD